MSTRTVDYIPTSVGRHQEERTTFQPYCEGEPGDVRGTQSAPDRGVVSTKLEPSFSVQKNQEINPEEKIPLGKRIRFSTKSTGKTSSNSLSSTRKKTRRSGFQSYLYVKRCKILNGEDHLVFG
ncbi:hypothetical protein chiPu_0017909 [Chiloscyllium punctatum]|uniref:Uncharacterized protein n=1 Tax=Chiloscyllium punctatum TaxID=137246 RepID=A0A401RJS5_CHIPU|nr:hypothetical protein [Chiloscyllium punctatum]